MKEFVDGEITGTQVLFSVGDQTFRVADYSLASGAVSAAGFMLGGLSSIIMLTLLF